MLQLSNLITALVLFLIYINAPAVAVAFHGVPLVVGAAIPLLLGIPLAYHLVIRQQGLVIGPALPWLLLFLIIQCIGALLAKWPEVALETLLTFFTEGVVLYLLISNLIRTPQTLRWATWALLAAGVVMGGVPLIQQLTGTFENNYGGFAQGGGPGFGTGEETVEGEVTQIRAAGSIGETNRYAQVMLMLIPLGVTRIWSERSRWLRLLATGATALAGAGALLAFSRGAAVAFVLTITIAAYMGYLSRSQIRALVIGTLLFLAVTPQYWARLGSLDAAWQVLTQGRGAEADGAVKGRATEMAAAVLVFMDHPVVGVGPGMFKHYAQEYGNRVGIRQLKHERQAHSLLLDVAAENGILGLSCFLMLLTVSLRHLALARKRWSSSQPELSNMATGYFLAVVTYLTTGLFLHFAYVRYFWLMLALADSVACLSPAQSPAGHAPVTPASKHRTLTAETGKQPS